MSIAGDASSPLSVQRNGIAECALSDHFRPPQEKTRATLCSCQADCGHFRGNPLWKKRYPFSNLWHFQRVSQCCGRWWKRSSRIHRLHMNTDRYESKTITFGRCQYMYTRYQLRLMSKVVLEFKTNTARLLHKGSVRSTTISPNFEVTHPKVGIGDLLVLPFDWNTTNLRLLSAKRFLLPH